MIVCLIQGIKTPDYDASLLYAGPYAMSQNEIDSVEDTFRQIMTKDYNGDSKKEINIISMAIMSDEQIKDYCTTHDESSYSSLYSNYSYETMLPNFYTEAYTGESLVGIIDSGLYDLLLQRESLYTLSEVLGYKPEQAFSEYGIYLKDTEIGKYFTSLSIFPENTVLCFRKASSTSIFRSKTSEQKRYDNSKILLEDILSFTAP